MSEQDLRASAALGSLARARLDDLLGELLARVDDVADSQERLRRLLDAVVGIAADLDLGSVLQRIVEVACQLSGARYGALGVVAEDSGGPMGTGRRLREFVTHGVSDTQRAAIGELPMGRGLLGVVIDAPEPLRLAQLSDHPGIIGFPPNHPPMRGFLGVPVRVRDRVFGNLYLCEKRTGDEFTDDDEHVVVALAAAAGVVIENARLYDDSNRRQRALEAAAEVTAAVLGPQPRTHALQLLAQRAREVSEASAAAVVVEDTGSPHVAALAGAGTANADVVVLPLAAVGRTSVVGSRQVPGVLVLGWSGQHQRRPVHEQLLGRLVEQVSLALQVAAARQDSTRLAVLEDRDRIGRDLHDLVVQRLFTVGLSLQHTAQHLDAGDVAARIGTAIDDVDATITDIRHTIRELASASSDLPAELAGVIDDVVDVLGFRPRLRIEHPAQWPVSDGVRGQVVAVAREALTNVARHADATSASVSLQVSESELILAVLDDGRGYVPGGRRSGIENMADRARSLGGTCTVRSRPEGGTEVELNVPVRR